MLRQGRSNIIYSGTLTWTAGSTATSNVKIDLNGAIAPTDYEIKVCYLFDLSGDCN